MPATTRSKPHIPQRPDELTAAWFTSVLPFAGAVAAVTCDEIGAGVGFIGEVYRCNLTWSAGSEPTNPDSVIVKVPTRVDENFALGDGLQLYEREITVYQKLRTTLGLPMPQYLYAAMDPDPAPWLERPLLLLFDKLPIGGINWLLAHFLKLAGRSKRRYVLVIEDITDAQPPSQLHGGTIDDVVPALELLARFHAHNWMRQDTIDAHHRIWAIDRACRAYQASYVRNLDSFQAMYGDRIGSEMLALLDRVHERVPELHADLAAEPWCLLHGDYRLDNLLFRSTGEIVVLDYQSVSYGRPAMDVAYFVTTALEAEHKMHEQGLLQAYHRSLVAAGVDSYPFEQLRIDCDKAKKIFAHRIVGAADMLDTDVDQGADNLLDVMQMRVLGWIS